MQRNGPGNVEMEEWFYQVFDINASGSVLDARVQR